MRRQVQGPGLRQAYLCCTSNAFPPSHPWFLPCADRESVEYALPNIGQSTTRSVRLLIFFNIFSFADREHVLQQGGRAVPHKGRGQKEPGRYQESLPRDAGGEFWFLMSGLG